MPRDGDLSPDSRAIVIRVYAAVDFGQPAAGRLTQSLIENSSRSAQKPNRFYSPQRPVPVAVQVMSSHTKRRSPSCVSCRVSSAGGAEGR